MTDVGDKITFHALYLLERRDIGEQRVVTGHHAVRLRLGHELSRQVFAFAADRINRKNERLRLAPKHLRHMRFKRPASLLTEQGAQARALKASKQVSKRAPRPALQAAVVKLQNPFLVNKPDQRGNRIRDQSHLRFTLPQSQFRAAAQRLIAQNRQHGPHEQSSCEGPAP